MSSWYFSSTPSVSDTVAGSSATASSSLKAVAQSSVSATPGDLNRSCLRSACTKPTTCSDKLLADARHLGAHDLQLARRGRIADPMVEAAPLERVVDLAGAVRGDDHDRRLRGLDRAELRDGDLEIRQHLEQERLERLVAAVEFVDQQHRRAGGVRLQRLQQRPLDQEALGEHVVLDPLAVALAARLRRRGSRSSARRSSTRTPPTRRRAPRSIAAGSAAARASLDSTLAISVLPTPASPSRKIGRPIFSARNSTVASDRSAR